MLLAIRARPNERKRIAHGRRKPRPAARPTRPTPASWRTQEELRRTVYATRSNLALAAWDANDVRRLRSLLDLLRPSSGEPDLRGWEWRYLWQLLHDDRLTLRAHDGRFTDVVFSPDGQTLAGLERNGRIQFWDRRTGQLLRTAGVTTRGPLSDLSPTSGVNALAFSPDGRRLAGPGPDSSLVLYAVDTGLPIYRFEGDPRAVLRLAWSPDGRTLVAALSSHTMRVWDARNGHMIHKAFGGHHGPVASVAFSPDGRTLASASYDRTVKLWRPRGPEAAARHPQRAHRRGPRRGFQPRRPADRLGRTRPVPPGLGCPVGGGTRRDLGAPRLGVVAGLRARQQEGRDGLRRRDGTRLGHRIGPGASHLQGAHRRGRRRGLQPRRQRHRLGGRRRDGAGLGRRQPAPPRAASRAPPC